MSKKVERLYAWIATDEDGREEIPAVITEGRMLPLICDGPEFVEAMSRVAQQYADESGRSLRLVRSDRLETVRTMPKKKGGP